MEKDFEFEESFSFWKNLSLCLIFFTVAPITILVSLFALTSFSKASSEKETINLSYHRQLADAGAKVFASFPDTLPSVSAEVEGKDARPELVRQYLASFESPLVPYADYVVSDADKYGLDYRLTTAIAQQESNLCKIIPPSTHNCWGWGITSVSSLSFDSFDEGIEIVSKGIKENYIDEGFITPEQIMTKYTPSSPNGAWAKGVRQFMSEIAEE